ncbi:hypothetical protein [Natrarchaeobius oligotrophus]|uniref:MarR family transcriptional regulator n=1 Tax=Natrarchaeobius chitinivorans TaxID=1679083 RepID=A0A3N6MZC4_NATCH|nr:hypothetical protein [Natrarchaeobius chitinivorans]RQH03501.1 hypothetical protein EA472_02815 [Natrarchaeobius chitinivorans]
MCRELRREPSWVAAIRLAFLQGRVDVESVVEEANLIPGKERTVRDVLSTMADRGLLEELDGRDCYVPGPVLIESDRYDLDFDRASDGGAHRWRSSG